MAWFAMGTATAYDPPVRNLTQVAVAVTAGTSVSQSLKVTVNQQASAPKGGPIPVTVTAWAAGEGTAS
jgi:hypothetical protein